MMDKDKIWKAILGEIEISLSRPNFLTWFKNTNLVSFDEDSGEMVISVPNNFTKEWLEKKYHKLILQAAENVTNEKVKKINYIIEGTPVNLKKTNIDLKKVFQVVEKEKKEEEKEKNGVGLNKRYTFDNFVVGKGNELVFAACKSVAENLGKRYNPLFIYGGVGLGKTHLLQAIGNYVKKNNKKAKILYTDAEKFTNEYVSALRHGTINKFKNIYRNLDLLLVDDVQFFAGKDRVQEEFFHTFNTLHQQDKQIVLTSDRPPKIIPAIEERLISRFEWGMIVDISPPDLETRIAILEKKAEERKVEFNREIYKFIASRIQRNVRELESALNKIIAYKELYNQQPTLEIVKNLISSDLRKARKSIISIKDILETVAEFYNIKVSDLKKRSRKRELVIPRQVAMYFIREETNASFPLIAQELGSRDHTTAIHAYKKIKKEIEEEGRIKQEIDYIRQRLYN